MVSLGCMVVPSSRATLGPRTYPLARSVRYYCLWFGQKPSRISPQLLRALICGRKSIPALANTDQHVLEVTARVQDGPAKIVGARWTIYRFNHEGRIDLGAAAGRAGAAIEGPRLTSTANVLDISRFLRARSLSKAPVHKPSPSVFRWVKADLQGKAKLPLLRLYNGSPILGR